MPKGHWKVTIKAFNIVMICSMVLSFSIAPRESSREFTWESTGLYLARPWEMIFFFLIFSRNTRLKKEILTRAMKHEIEWNSDFSRRERELFPWNFRMKVIVLRKIMLLLALFYGKYQSSCMQRIRFSRILVRIVWITILHFVLKSEIEGNVSRSHLEAWDWLPEILVSSRCAMFE